MPLSNEVYSKHFFSLDEGNTVNKEPVQITSFVIQTDQFS